MKYPKDIKDWPECSVYGYDFRHELLKMANAIIKLELWEWMKNNEISKRYKRLARMFCIWI